MEIKTEKEVTCPRCNHTKTIDLKQAPKGVEKTCVEYAFMDIRDFLGDQAEGWDDLIWEHASNRWNLGNDSYLSMCLDGDYIEDEDEVIQFFYNTFIKPHEAEGHEVLFYVCW